MLEKMMLFLRNYKGAISSLLGLILAFPVNLYFMTMFFMNEELPREQLESLAIMNFIAVVWYMLPSKIEIGGKLFTLKLED